MIYVFVIAHLAGEHHEVESLIEVAKKKQFSLTLLLRHSPKSSVVLLKTEEDGSLVVRVVVQPCR